MAIEIETVRLLNGRTCKVKALSIPERWKFVGVVGNLAENRLFMYGVFDLVTVREINGFPVIFPNTLDEFYSNIGMLQDGEDDLILAHYRNKAEAVKTEEQAVEEIKN